MIKFTNHNKKDKQKFLNAFGKLKEDPFDFEQIENYFRKKDNSAAFQVLSDKTCRDLDFNELFMFLDRTNSKVGQQFLYNQLRTIPSDSNKTEHEKLISEFTNNSSFRVDIQGQLAKLNKMETFYIHSLFQDEHLKPPKWFFVIKLLSFTGLLLLILLFFYSQAFFAFLGVFIINAGVHYWNKRNLYPYLASLPQLLKLNSIARDLFKFDILKKINPNLQESIRIVGKIKNRISFFKMEANMQGDLMAIVWGFFELLKILFLLEPLLLFRVIKDLDSKRKEIEELFLFVGQIDSLLSVASLRYSLNNYCVPKILDEDKGIIVKDMYHPLINDCVKNSISAANKSVLLTGSNMSGKTSFIKTIGINTITGLTLNTCFSKEFYLPKLRIYSAIRINDDLMNDKSYYFEEVLTIKEMIDNSDNGTHLFLLDEIFKGTNTIERVSAGKAVLRFLAGAGNIVFVSTHDIELADLLKDEYSLYHFSEKVDNNKVVNFDYKLKEGKLKNRNAIQILQANDYPDEVIHEATELSEELEKKYYNTFRE